MATRTNYLLIDLDDTLGGVEIDGVVHGTSQAYNAVLTEFAEFMASLGFDPRRALETQQALDSNLCTRYGFSDKGRFPQSLRYAYAHLAGESADARQAEEAERLGWKVFEFPYRSLPGAISTLAALSKEYKIAIVTKGNEEEQRKKVFEMGLFPYADQVIVMGHKSVEEWEEKVVQALRLDMPKRLRSWAIGDSVKSDINPPLELGINAIHIPGAGWSFEQEPYGTPQPHAKLFSVESIGDVLKHIPLT